MGISGAPLQSAFEAFARRLARHLSRGQAGPADEGVPCSQGADNGRVRHLTIRQGVGYRVLQPGVRQVREGQHHTDLEQGLRRLERDSGRHRDNYSQPRQAKGQASGRPPHIAPIPDINIGGDICGTRAGQIQSGENAQYQICIDSCQVRQKRQIALV